MGPENILYSLDISELEEAKVYSYWYDRMKEDRKNKIDAMKPRSGKLLSLGAGILLEKAMETAGIQDYEMVYGEQKKPYIKGHDDVFFNLSHSKDKVILALSDKEIGADTEKNQHFKDSLINYVFCDSDIELAKDIAQTIPELSENAADEKKVITALDRVYTMFWTMKESVMKHSGMGISMEPKKIRLFRGDGFFTAKAEKYDCSRLKLFSYEKGSYQITVCTEYDSFPDVTQVKL